MYRVKMKAIIKVSGRKGVGSDTFATVKMLLNLNLLTNISDITHTTQTCLPVFQPNPSDTGMNRPEASSPLLIQTA